MGIVIRPAEKRDIPAMAAIRSRRWGAPDYWIDRIGRYLDGEQLAQKSLSDNSVFVAEDSGVIVGFAAGHRTRRYQCDGELQWIDIIDERRREGIAAMLLAAVGNWFVAHSLVRICVDVDPENRPARNFYAKHGAVPLKPHWMVWEDARSMSTDAAHRV
jgi:GNAT superfamily N-acetyltransferase